MHSYYNTLDVSPEASYSEIKKAYFSLVRKYPPERYPDEFMQIREAYEMLSDEKTRKQYDEIDTLPDEAKKLVRYSEKALQEGNSEEVVQILEPVVKEYPGYSVIKHLLGEAYKANGNTGKTVKIFEQLVKEQPQNAGFAGKLAHAYLDRGWHKKAIDQYLKALERDQDNISLWLGLIDCHLKAFDYRAARDVAYEALDVSSKNGWDNLELYYYIIQVDLLTGRLEEFEQHLAEMKMKAQGDDEDRSNVAWFLASLSQKLHSFGLYKESSITINIAGELLPGDEEIIEMRDEITQETAILHELEELEEDSTVDETFRDIFEFESKKCDCIDCKVTQLCMEVYIVSQIEKMRASIRKIKSNYPALYSLKKDFFDLVLNPKKEEYLLESYAKKYEQYRKRYPEHFDDEPHESLDEEDYITSPTEPVRRDGPKIGRNDPCVCGSGKKYKKCCGK